MSKCTYPKCRSEDVLIWLGKPLCQKHWEWVCETEDKEIVYVKLGRPTTKTPVQVPTLSEQDSPKEEKQEEKKEKQPYTEDIDKVLLELKNKNTPIGEIAKAVGRSYASVIYRLSRVLLKKS